MSEKDIQQRIDEFISANTDAIIEDIAAVVAVPSVEAEAAPGAPFGAEVRRALDIALGIARRMGLATNTGDGYVGWAELPGREAGHLATITHLDVVPAGEGWNGDPFLLRRQNGWLIGRGVQDDKGPSILCLYIAKFFKELAQAQGAPQRYGLRVLLGCNEENGMGDLPHYLQNNEMPLFCFTPDADFPVCNGEKGHFGGNFISAPLSGNILDFKGGLANNAVPDRAECLLKTAPASLQPTARVTVAPEAGGVRLSARGVAGHAAFPDTGCNAIGLLVDYLLDNALCTPEENQFLALLQKLHHATNGSGLDIACADDAFGPLTIIGGVINFEGGRLRQSVDSRFPTATTGQELTQKAQAAAAAAGAVFQPGRIMPPFYIPADAPAIRTLLDTFNELTGRSEVPFTIGGGTYARHFKSAVSFGPELRDASYPDFVGSIHGANEGIELAWMQKALKIYILSLWRLQNIDFT